LAAGAFVSVEEELVEVLGAAGVEAELPERESVL